MQRTLRGSAVTFSISGAEVRTLAPVRDAVERVAASDPDLRDVFLCHAWDDRAGAAKDLHDHLVDLGVAVWFSEKDLGLGTSMMRGIDKGLKNSRLGIVLVTPALLQRLEAEGVADRELSVLLFSDRVVPVAHQTTFEALRDVSPMLASRSGLDTAESSLRNVAIQIADTVHREKDSQGR